MPEKGVWAGRQNCRLRVVEMLSGKEGRENRWAQIGISACVLLLPPILAIAVLAPHSVRHESGETPGLFKLAESSSTLQPLTEGRFWHPSGPRNLPAIGPTNFDDRFKGSSVPPPPRSAADFSTTGARSDQQTDVAGGPQSIIDTSSEAFAAFSQAVPPSADAKGIIAESRAEPETQKTPSPPAARSSAHQVSNRSGADEVLDAQSTSRVHTSTCLPSASAVRQDHPGAWPSWTLRALGHEGTKCWYAGTRATAHNHWSEMTTLLFRTALAALPNAKIWDNFS
jgi:hypothetical protein